MAAQNQSARDREQPGGARPPHPPQGSAPHRYGRCGSISVLAAGSAFAASLAMFTSVATAAPIQWHLEYPGSDQPGRNGNPPPCQARPCPVRGVIDDANGQSISQVRWFKDQYNQDEYLLGDPNSAAWPASWQYSDVGFHAMQVQAYFSDGSHYFDGQPVTVADRTATIDYVGPTTIDPRVKSKSTFRLDFNVPNYSVYWFAGKDHQYSGEPIVLRDWTDGSGHHVFMRVSMAPGNTALQLQVKAWNVDESQATYQVIDLHVAGGQPTYAWQKPKPIRRVRCRRRVCIVKTVLRGFTTRDTHFENFGQIVLSKTGKRRARRRAGEVIASYQGFVSTAEIKLRCRDVKGQTARYTVRQSVTGQFKYSRTTTLRFQGCKAASPNQR